MAEPFEILEAALLSLPPHGRRRLFQSLARSLEPGAEESGGPSGLSERMEEWRAGRLEALPLDVARAVIRERLVHGPSEPA